MYLLILIYSLSGIKYTHPVEPYTQLEYCQTALTQTSKSLIKQGANILAVSCIYSKP